ncbi:DUF2000 family protein [Dyadobacter sp. LJ53]|uniref:DUF2000 family protein n=1 Tax=Dyadobacter chenwenxiniae TaxID=2906456 RepID=UPI001F18B32E|nr:DUF2000 family protein [Dyadobacter chenwenxiniae]MCF0049054.1 DUF2000 family protein [Dyadobacter chenwenxiniae]
MYEHKIAVVILSDLLDWQKLNVTAFLASSMNQECKPRLIGFYATGHAPLGKVGMFSEIKSNLKNGFNQDDF